MKNTYKKATFAGGCFWCMVKPFDELPGIEKVVSGYTGGSVSNPSYNEVKTGVTGHYEAIQITYDPSLFTYESLLNLYWPQIDPTDDGGQFFDRGSQYRTAIFYHDEEQKMLAEKSLAEIEQTSRFKAPIVTKVLSASIFYEAEEEHQKFYKKEPERYEQEREESGRKKFIEENWKTKV
ncbi:peptide-methionine (S)-S-oxide reductase [Salipaludibacillus neizhouensis]|uniref:Peptide methionine sulfoxide reductase MsrA n=1 Tax=Salipaludibacillus neizhouensis TaxID=885475 RepID=A0A3A9KFI9_9BACI|nr:peptide-methionine (S)-S-oxide reductase MsrA [Salipaludibacillus neizhouensis]RKL69332.1 peptide-methionine (S)-S-oxide reductase [Salipaludibacillus neizhouensis]